MSRTALVALALSSLASPAVAFELEAPGPLSAEVQVKLRSAFDGLPASGALPLWVEITNGGDRDRDFSISTEALASDPGSVERVFREVLSVPAGARRQVEVFAPMPAALLAGSGWCSMRVRVETDGLGPWRAYRSHRIPTSSEGRPSVGFGVALPEPDVALKGAVRGDVHGVGIDVSLLPTDARGLIGLDALWLTDDEARRVPPAARAALAAWVAQGGDLVLFADAEAPAPASLPMRAADWASGAYGLGRLYRLEPAAQTREALAEALGSLRARVVISEHDVRAQRVVKAGAVRRAVAPVEVSRGRIFAFLGGLALLIGPLNLFLIAPKRRRTRLLWSTPMLSLAASLALVLMILSEDGLGGEGQRAQFVLQMPDAKVRARWQVQATRTGLLPGAGFELDGALYVEALLFGEQGSLRLRTELAPSEDGSRLHASGDWFRTRAVQAQLLYAVEPSRARVRWRRQGGGVSVTSGLGYPLEALIFFDEAGRPWRGAGLSPGRTLALEPAGEAEAQALLQELSAGLPGHLAGRLEATLPRPGWILARAGADALEPWSTLPRLRWTDRPTAVVTPASPAEEEAR